MAADKSKGQALQHWIAKCVPQLHRKTGRFENGGLTEVVRFQAGLLGAEVNIFGYRPYYFGRLLKDRVAAALAVVSGSGETLPVVVVQNKVLALVPDDV